MHGVAGSFVVEAEAFLTVADLDEAGVVADPTAGWRAGRRDGRLGRRSVGRGQRVERQEVLDVHEHQLLVLLLVVQPELDQLRDGVVRRIGEEERHRLVDMRSVAGDLGHPRAGDHAAFGTGMAGPGRLVVGVEQVAVGGVEPAVAGERRVEDKGLEEPGGVGPVPLGRAGVGHRLQVWSSADSGWARRSVRSRTCR